MNASLEKQNMEFIPTAETEGCLSLTSPVQRMTYVTHVISHVIATHVDCSIFLSHYPDAHEYIRVIVTPSLYKKSQVIIYHFPVSVLCLSPGIPEVHRCVFIHTSVYSLVYSPTVSHSSVVAVNTAQLCLSSVRFCQGFTVICYGTEGFLHPDTRSNVLQSTVNNSHTVWSHMS